MSIFEIFKRRKSTFAQDGNKMNELSAINENDKSVNQSVYEHNGRESVARNIGREIGGELHKMDDESFDEMKDSLVRHNEMLDGKYDEIARRLKSVMDDPIPKDIEQIIEKLKTDYDEMRMKLSDARRLGKDVLIPALVLKQFSAKLKLAQNTRNIDDVMKAELVLKQAAFELSQAKEIKEINVKKEIYAMAGLDDNGTPLEKKYANDASGEKGK